MYAGFPTILHGTFSTLNKSGGDVRTSQFSFLKEMDRRWQMAQRDAENRLRDSQAALQVEARKTLQASGDRLRIAQAVSDARQNENQV